MNKISKIGQFDVVYKKNKKFDNAIHRGSGPIFYSGENSSLSRPRDIELSIFTTII
jgi:hypothetical protein